MRSRRTGRFVRRIPENAGKQRRNGPTNEDSCGNGGECTQCGLFYRSHAVWLQHFNTELKIAGVIFNQVTSAAQYGFLRETCAEAGVECLGYLPYLEEAGLPPRHQALTLPARKSLDQLLNQVAEQLAQHVDIDKLLNLSTRIFPCAYLLPYISETETDMWTGKRKQRIALASDPAFPFVYRQSIDRTKGDITRFSPVYGSELPEADIVYLSGGYPELFARQLHRRKRLMEQLREYVEKGGNCWQKEEEWLCWDRH